MPAMATGNIPFATLYEQPGAVEETAARSYKIAQAKAFLERQLANGPRPATDVLLAAAAAEIAEGTLYTAKRRMRVQSRRQGYQGVWLWTLRYDAPAIQTN